MKFEEKKFFLSTFLLILITEFFSLAAYQANPILHSIFLGFILAAAGILTFVKLEYAIFIVIAELFVSSFGHLFQVSFGPIYLPLRIGLFMVVNAAFFIRTLKNKNFEFRKSKYFWPSCLVTAAIILGFVVAFIKGNSLQNIFNDANGYIFFSYFPIIYLVLKNSESRNRLSKLFAASILWLTVQTAIVLFIFAHRLRDPMQVLYLWIRDARIGEITQVLGDFYRIFFQSYNFALIGVFVFAALLIQSKNNIFKDRFFWFFVASTFLVLESFSRSFWFGGTISIISMLITLFILKFSAKNIFFVLAKMFIGSIFALAIIFATVNFPFPEKGPPILLADLFRGRATAFFGEAAAGSRWQLLPEMWREIKKDPIFGSGFGKTITFRTEDPRYLSEDPTGMRTTFAFEWSYFDLWLKLGIVGLIAFGWLIVSALHDGWAVIKSSAQNNFDLETYGVWLGLIALVGANVFTPYFNHPLGIGALILSAIWFERRSVQK